MADHKTDPIQTYLQSIYSKKPHRLKIDLLKWKYLIRGIFRGKNTLIVGPTGCGKTLAAIESAKATNRPFVIINMGSTQDPRTTLIGKTRFNKETGTYFDRSPFVEAIQIPNSVIILDEVSRGHPEAWNILIPVLDELQRTMRLDEAEGGRLVSVAPGVTFIATANIGSEYTATRVMDRALLGRFTVKIEMGFLSKEDEKLFLLEQYPSLNKSMADHFVEIASDTRISAKSGLIHSGIPTRSVVEMAELSIDGFTLSEIAEMVIYPDYPDDGGSDSERTKVRQIVQKMA